MEIFPLADRQEFIWELAELHGAEWKHLDPKLSIEKRAEAISNAAGRKGIPSIFIATSQNQLVGSAALVQKDMDTHRELSPWLAAVYVKEYYRGQGYATALIERCENEAIQSGVNAWYLFTEFAAKLYEKLGWCYVERCEFRGVMVDVMSKQIGS